MNEFKIINKYLKPLSLKNLGSLKLSDDIFFQKKNGLAISVDTYVEGIHFFKSLDPNKFIKKVLRASLSDLYSKGINPETYFLSFALNKKLAKHAWLSKIKKILQNEQKKFNITLGGGDTTYSNKLVITVIVLGYSKKNPVFRKGSSANEDIYVTGNIGDSFIGLNVLKKKVNFGKDNSYFIQKYYHPVLPTKISLFLNKIATASIDISDGLAQDLNHLCKESKCGALININLLPISKQLQKMIIKHKLNIKKIFSNGDDYQILFTSKKDKRLKINQLSKKLNVKISRIGSICKKKNIIFKYNGKKFAIKSSEMGYTHIFS